MWDWHIVQQICTILNTVAVIAQITQLLRRRQLGSVSAIKDVVLRLTVVQLASQLLLWIVRRQRYGLVDQKFNGRICPSVAWEYPVQGTLDATSYVSVHRNGAMCTVRTVAIDHFIADASPPLHGPLFSLLDIIRDDYIVAYVHLGVPVRWVKAQGVQLTPRQIQVMCATLLRLLPEEEGEGEGEEEGEGFPLSAIFVTSLEPFVLEVEVRDRKCWGADANVEVGGLRAAVVHAMHFVLTASEDVADTAALRASVPHNIVELVAALQEPHPQPASQLAKKYLSFNEVS